MRTNTQLKARAEDIMATANRQAYRTLRTTHARLQFTIHIDASSITFRVNGMAYDMWELKPGEDHVLARAGRVHEHGHRPGW